MKAYEERRRPSWNTRVNLIVALETSLKIIKRRYGQKSKRHQSLASAFRAALASLNLTILPKQTNSHNVLTAIYYPKV
jgi:alanine-glyoxylate transaminase/serine-glyoxylate transaminase/serine-pyruvate transaminase